MSREGPVVSVLTLGCKLNQADSERIARRLAGEGVRVTDRPTRGADAFVINTCSRSEEHTSELKSLMRISYAVFCLKKQTNSSQITTETPQSNEIRKES